LNGKAPLKQKAIFQRGGSRNSKRVQRPRDRGGPKEGVNGNVRARDGRKVVSTKVSKTHKKEGEKKKWEPSKRFQNKEKKNRAKRNKKRNQKRGKNETVASEGRRVSQWPTYAKKRTGGWSQGCPQRGGGGGKGLRAALQEGRCEGGGGPGKQLRSSASGRTGVRKT